MKKIFYLLIVLSIHSPFFSQIKGIPKKMSQKGFAKIDFLSMEMPYTTIPNEQNLGFTGIHYNLLLDKSFYTGIGIYGAVSGFRGGFFTLGVNAGIKKHFSKKFYIDTGFHFGGGGGAGAPDGGGAFILPHFNLGYQLKKISLNSGWSYVNFFDGGNIKGHQINIGVEIPLDYVHADYKVTENKYELLDLEKTDWYVNSKRTSLMLHFNNLMIKGEDKNINVQKFNGATIKLAGFELANYFSKNWFTFLKVDGAYDGIRAGYMDVFLGTGYHFEMNKKRTNILMKFGIGAGGGGGVDTKGGFLLYPDLSLEQKLYNDVFLSLNKGFVTSPDAHFYTSSFGVGVKYYIERNGVKTDNSAFTLGQFKGIDVIVKQDLYFNAKREKPPKENMHQISLQLNLYVNKNIFIAGQTSFANFGNAGAYAEGIIGLGIKSNPLFSHSTTVFTQLLGGAAGGGNISTGQGLIIKPSLGVDYEISKNLSLRTSGGFVRAVEGQLSSPFINLGIKYNISILKLK
jgi:hypothetical protein